MNLTHENLSPHERTILGAFIGIYARRWMEDPQRKLHDIHEKVIKPALGMQNGDRVLEVGVGIGDHLKSYRGFNYWGVDTDPQALMLAQENADLHEIDDRRILQTSPRNLPFKDGEFERVFSLCTLHEVEDITQTLTEIDRVLSKNGRVAIAERITAYGESPEAQARLREEPLLLPKWFGERSYQTETKSFKASYWGESLEGKPSFDFYLFIAQKTNKT